MVYPYSGILLSNKTEWTFDTYNMEDSQNSFAEQKKPYRKKKECMLYDSIYIKF